MRDLQEMTHEIHYENYRLERIRLKTLIHYDDKNRKLIQEKDEEVKRLFF